MNHQADVAFPLPVYSHHQVVTGSVITLVLSVVVLVVVGIARRRRR